MTCTGDRGSAQTLGGYGMRHAKKARREDAHEGIGPAEKELLRVRAPVATRVSLHLRLGKVELREQRRLLPVPRWVVLVPVALRQHRYTREQLRSGECGETKRGTYGASDPVRGFVDDAGEEEERRHGLVLPVVPVNRILQRLVYRPR